MNQLVTQDHSAIRNALENFVAKGTDRDHVVRKIVWDSWTRCRDYGIDVRGAIPALDTDASNAGLDRWHAELASAASAAMDHISRASNDRCLGVLANDTGMIIKVTGNQRLIDSGRENYIYAGTNWSEHFSGTNAVGTALATRRPVHIQATEHFYSDLAAWSCAAVPVTDPITGEIVGVIDVTSQDPGRVPQMAALAAFAAAMTEQELRLREQENHSRLLEAYLSRSERIHNDAMILLDSRARVIHINDSGRDFLRRSSPELKLDVNAQLAVLQRGRQLHQGVTEQLSWLRTEWAEPICPDGREVGLLITIPAPQLPASARPSPAAPVAPRAPIADSSWKRVVGRSPALLQAISVGKRLAATKASIMILGETGTGKEVFAKAIHDSSVQRSGPFIAFNCGAVPHELMAAELFGYEDGAFTGARRGGKPGKFEAANGGTLFLDEIGEMPKDLQVYLLRALEERTIVRLGSAKEITVDLRIISATNKDLNEEIKAKNFRADLYHRLSVSVIDLPSLHQRIDDLETLSNHFLDMLAETYGERKTLSVDALGYLRRYNWPGNIRELRNALEHMYIQAEDNALHVEHLPAAVRTHIWDDDDYRQLVDKPEPGFGNRRSAEKLEIVQALSANRWCISRTAETLSMSRTTLYKKLREYDLNQRAVD